MYNPSPGSSACVPCPGGQLADPPVGSVQCITCPPGATCVATRTPLALEGFYHAPGHSFQFYACPEGYCKGEVEEATDVSSVTAAAPAISAHRRRHLQQANGSDLAAAAAHELEPAEPPPVPPPTTPTCGQAAGLYVEASEPGAVCRPNSEVCMVPPPSDLQFSGGIATCEMLEYLGNTGTSCTEGNTGPLCGVCLTGWVVQQHKCTLCPPSVAESSWSATKRNGFYFLLFLARAARAAALPATRRRSTL